MYQTAGRCPLHLSCNIQPITLTGESKCCRIWFVLSCIYCFSCYAVHCTVSFDPRSPCTLPLSVLQAMCSAPDSTPAQINLPVDQETLGACVRALLTGKSVGIPSVPTLFPRQQSSHKRLASSCYGKIINFSEILGNVPKIWETRLKFWETVPKFIWEIFRPPSDLRALILLRSNERDKQTFTALVYYPLQLCQQGPLRYNSEISSYNPPTDRQDAGRPLKHGLPV